MGWSNDWEKEIATHLPEYYKWTQWIFAQMYKHDLAYQDARLQWWCTKCQTVLANEQVIDGKCWRHDATDDPLVEKKEVKQWFFKITDYADELLEAIDGLDWTESVKLAQKNWIGRSQGTEITFQIAGLDDNLKVFTTRADTLHGATFMVVAPEHPLVAAITTDQRDAVDAYVRQAQTKSEVERQEAKDKTGVFTGVYAVNPVNNENIPIWIADYVLMGYGTGAIMAVPAHDERDRAFAKRYDLPIREVVEPETGVRQLNPEYRRSIVAIVRNPKSNQILTIDWGKDNGGTLYVGGGRDEDEDVVETARREIAEETGYTNLKLVAQTGKIHHHYYAHSKQVARQIEVHGLLFDLEDESRAEQQLEDNEKGLFTVNWLDADQAEKQVTEALHAACYRLLVKGECYHGEGIMVNSGEFDGMNSAAVREAITERFGIAKVNYRMRDWSVSRQRYWGAPIPIVNCPKDGAVLVPDDQLPVVLPELDDFKPSGDGRSALARAKDWVATTCPQCNGPAERETDTLDTYICSSWYMYRYFDPHNQSIIFDSELVKKWEPIDFYNGADHAIAHLLYARFIGHFFKKLGLVDEAEPFKQFLFNGKVTAADGTMFSKSKGNGIDPLEVIDSGYGADSLRLYLMFAAPLDIWVKWSPQGVPGAYRFLSRLWNLVKEYRQAEERPIEADDKTRLLRGMHQMIRKMTDDIEENRYNTAIAAAMGQLNELYALKQNIARNDAWQWTLESMVSVVAPFAPHIAEELWFQLGHSSSIHKDSWPQYDEQYLVQDTITFVVQVNGKLRANLLVHIDSSQDEVVNAAKADGNVSKHLGGKIIVKTIYVSGKIVNFVVK